MGTGVIPLDLGTIRDALAAVIPQKVLGMNVKALEAGFALVHGS
jgi:Pyruvate/2-oxoacid:ferredoxin oxidoreductase gamma subunit